MINDDIFTTVIITFMLSLVSTIFFIISIISGIIFYKNTKQKQIIGLTLIFCLFFGFMSCLCVPWAFLYKAYSAFDNAKESIKYHKLAIKTAVLPSVKSEMYIELGSYYAKINEGQEAINNYEKALSIYEKTRPSIQPLGILYLAKGDYDEAVDFFESHKKTSSLLAEAHLLKRNYPKALKAINTTINQTTAKSWDYMLRSVIYRKMNEQVLAKNDLQKALELCQTKECPSEVKFYYDNYNNAYEDKFMKLHKQYKFEK